MLKRIFFVSLIACFSFFISSCFALTDANNVTHIVGARSHVDARIEKVINASYNVIGVTFYFDKKDLKNGMVRIGLGRGLMFKDKEALFLSCSHIFSYPDIHGDPGKIISAEKYFVITDWSNTDKKMEDISFFLKENKKNLSLKKFNAFFDSPSFKKNTIGLRLKTLKSDLAIDSACVKIDNYNRYDIDFLSINDFDIGFDNKLGRQIAVWGTPFSFGEWYREGVVASNVYTNFFVISVACGPGDSGGVVISLDSGKVAGVISGGKSLKSILGTRLYPIPNGFVIKIDSYLRSLDLKK